MLETLARDCLRSRFWWVTDSCLIQSAIGDKPTLAVRRGDSYLSSSVCSVGPASVLQSYMATQTDRFCCWHVFSGGNKPITLQSHI